MKITKLSKGYRINLSDTELSLLHAINDEGIQTFFEMHQSNLTGLASSEKKTLTEILTNKREWF